jgi:hypothetical protein
LEQSDNPGIIDPKLFSNAESVAGLTLSAFIGIVFSQPRVLAALEPWAELANAFGVITRYSNCITTQCL